MNTHSSIYGPTKGKTGSKVQKPTFYSIVYTGYKLHLLTCCPQKSGVPRPIEHSETVIACMSKQILALFQLKKLKKGDIHQKNAIKGERNGFFQKGPKRAKKGEHLWERATSRTFVLA